MDVKMLERNKHPAKLLNNGNKAFYHTGLVQELIFQQTDIQRLSQKEVISFN